MKKVNIWIIATVVMLMLVVTTILTIVVTSFAQSGTAEDAADLTRRYIAICTDPQSDGWRDIKSSLVRSAEANHVAIEFLEEGFEKDRADASCIEMAVDAGVDGIVIYINDAAIDAELEYAAENDVPVISVIEGYRHDSIFQLEADSSLLAERMVRYIDGMDARSERVAIISSNASENYKLSLFQLAFYESGRKVTTRTFSGPHVFDANETVKELISSEGEIDMICCLDSTATLGVAQSIVELNKVNVLPIVGCGKNDEILNMIRKGIVAATLAVDYEAIGQEALEMLMRNTKPIRYEHRRISEVYVIDRTNVEL